MEGKVLSLSYSPSSPDVKAPGGRWQVPRSLKQSQALLRAGFSPATRAGEAAGAPKSGLPPGTCELPMSPSTGLRLEPLKPRSLVATARHHSSPRSEADQLHDGDGVIQSDRVFKALMETDRAHYCKDFPFEDSPQSIGYHATISAPHMHAHALECLKDHLYEGARALDVGSGSGYLSACMARMVGPSGLVVGVDHIPQLVEQSISNVQTDNASLLAEGGLKLIVGDGRNGHLEHAPYDAIHVGAAAAAVPEALLQQLRLGGRLVIPVGSREGGQQLEQYDKTEDGSFTRTPLMRVAYVPLTDRKRQWSGHEL